MQRLVRTTLNRFATLTHLEAQQRAQVVKQNSIVYNSHLTLHKGTTYNGLTNISFSTTSSLSEYAQLRIDFKGKQINKIMINQHVLSNPEQFYSSGAINLPSRYLHVDQPNNLLIQYTNEYDKDGNGCVSFTDVDDKQYLYTQFQPYYANRVFPLFDQPDLKAPLQLTIACPQSWGSVLSNQFPIHTSDHSFSVCSITQKVIQSYKGQHSQIINQYQLSIPQQYKKRSFAQTQLLPSYLYCFVVGPYKELQINVKNKGKPNYVPMKLYSIQSLYPQLQKLAPYIEETTVTALNFFRQYFGYRYPFSKYDQVFAHEYKWGAMQNAGVVTLNDLYLFKDKVSNEKMLSFGNTIVHQLAHHWFGNLVTMKWWDDLWLNQSFAEYISHFCLQKIKNNMKTISFQSAMVSFLNRKSWGYAEDQMVTTHAIRGTVADTYTAQSIFDGITYSKGAATMKQLMYLIGQEAFSAALTIYFHKYAFKNAVLDDLLATMEPAFQTINLGFTLQEWKQMWLQTAGCNILSCQWQAGSSTIAIVQKADREECLTLRLHRIKVALVQKDHSIITQEVIVLPQSQTEIAMKVPNQTVAVLPNYQDLTFAKIELDPLSRTYFRDNLNKVKDSLSRALIWKSYFNMVKDCKITSREYMNFVLQNIKKEYSDPIVEEQLGLLLTAVTHYTPRKYRENLYQTIHALLLSFLGEIKDNQENRRVILRDKIVDFSHTEAHQELLRKWYYGQACPLSSSGLHNTLRWKIVTRLSGKTLLSQQQKIELVQNMSKKDASDDSINKQISCESLIVQDHQSLLQLYLGLIVKAKEVSHTKILHGMRGLNHEIHEEFIRKTMYLRYFQDVARFLRKDINTDERWFLEGDYFENFLVYLDPCCDSTALDLADKIKQFSSLSVTDNHKIQRTILKKIDLLQRRKKAYQYFEGQEASNETL